MQRSETARLCGLANEIHLDWLLSAQVSFLSNHRLDSRQLLGWDFLLEYAPNLLDVRDVVFVDVQIIIRASIALLRINLLE